MKTHRTKHCSHSIACFLLLLLGLATLTGCSLFRKASGGSASQQKTPPKPEQPSSVLQLPATVRAEEIKGQASLPEELKLGFALDLAGKVVPGNWDVQAKVVSADKNSIAFQTGKGESGHLVYRLPEQMQLPLKSGQSIEIKRTLRGYQVSLGYELLVTSDGRTMVGSGRLFGDNPIAVSVGKDLSLQQVSAQTLSPPDDKNGGNYPVAVIVSSSSSRQSMTMGKLTDFDLQGSKLSALVTESVLIVPPKDSEGAAEGKGYILEYVVTTGGEPVPSPKP